MPVETVISTIRHFQTRYNAEKRYAGTIDIPLSDLGVGECRKVGPLLAACPFDVVVTSTLRRAVDSARLLLGDGVPIVQTPLCNERCFGIMEGCTWDEVVRMEPPVLMINVGGDLHTVNPSGGEPFEEVWDRARKFRRFLFKNYLGKSILVVSHGVFLQMFHGLLRGSSCIDSLAVFPAHAELRQFRFRGRRRAGAETRVLVPAGPEARF